MASGTWCVWLLPQWQKPPLTRWTFARPGEITLVNSKSPSRSSWLFLIINRPHSSQAPDSGGVVLWQRKRKSLQRDDPHHVWNCQRGGFSHSQNKNHKIYELFFVFRGCSSCGEACCRLFTDMQYIPVGINLSVAIGYELEVVLMVIEIINIDLQASECPHMSRLGIDFLPTARCVLFCFSTSTIKDRRRFIWEKNTFRTRMDFHCGRRWLLVWVQEVSTDLLENSFKATIFRENIHQINYFRFWSVHGFTNRSD